MPRTGHRRLALLGSLLLLSNCSGFGVFLDDTHSATAHVNRPIGDSENMKRIEGDQVPTQAISAESGNVWPGPVPPEPTLEDLQNTPARTLSNSDGVTPPPMSNVPNLLIPAIPHHLQPRPGDDGGVLSGPISNPMTPSAVSPQGIITPTPRGNAVNTRVPSGIPQSNVPAMPGLITVPNGNGTSTVIAPDGTITTIPTPK